MENNPSDTEREGKLLVFQLKGTYDDHLVQADLASPIQRWQS